MSLFEMGIRVRPCQSGEKGAGGAGEGQIAPACLLGVRLAHDVLVQHSDKLPRGEHVALRPVAVGDRKTTVRVTVMSRDRLAAVVLASLGRQRDARNVVRSEANSATGRARCAQPAVEGMSSLC